jgi:hypothetical protein
MLARCDLFRISGWILLLRVVMLSIFLWLFVYVPGLVWAQNPNGALRGEIQDAKGARVVNARIVAQATGSSMSRTAAANGQGEFRIEGLLPGSYQVIVTAKGFAEAVADVDVAVSAVRDIKVILKLESGRETVNVQGTPSSITSATIDRTSNLFHYRHAASPTSHTSCPELSRSNLPTPPRRALPLSPPAGAPA